MEEEEEEEEEVERGLKLSSAFSSRLNARSYPNARQLLTVYQSNQRPGGGGQRTKTSGLYSAP